MSLKKIADMTGVSVSTVGRILSDPKHKCADEETRKKVIEAARQIQYVPNFAARSLKSGGEREKTYRVNIVTARARETSDPFYDEMLIITERELRDCGCIVQSVVNLPELADERMCRSDNREHLLSRFSPDNAKSDGTIIIGEICERAAEIVRAKEKNIVLISRSARCQLLDDICCDGAKTAAEAVKYLINAGHTNIGFAGTCGSEPRYRGYMNTLFDSRINAKDEYVYDTVAGETHGFEAMDYFMRLPTPPTAVYCANDIIAVGMLRFAAQKKLRSIPSIISSDGIDEAQYTKPMLTTVSLPQTEMAHIAMATLLDRIKGGHRSPIRTELTGTLTVRESCRPYVSQKEPEYFI